MALMGSSPVGPQIGIVGAYLSKRFRSWGLSA